MLRYMLPTAEKNHHEKLTNPKHIDNNKRAIIIIRLIKVLCLQVMVLSIMKFDFLPPSSVCKMVKRLVRAVFWAFAGKLIVVEEIGRDQSKPSQYGLPQPRPAIQSFTIRSRSVVCSTLCFRYRPSRN